LPKVIATEPASFMVTGFSVGDLLQKDFVTEITKEFPKAVVAAIIISIEDPKGIVSISHPLKDGKIQSESVEVDGSEPKFVQRILDILKRS